MKRNIIYIFIVVGLFLTLNFLVDIPAPNARAKCPEDYTGDDAGTAEYRTALISWTSEFFKEHPEATMSDWLEAKSKFWLDNNCVVALERFKMSGEVKDLKPWEMVDYDIQNAILGTYGKSE